VVSATLEHPVILSPEVLSTPDPGKAKPEALVDLTRKSATPLDGFLIMHRSGGSEAEIDGRKV
jgi:hypothetical protein